MEYKLKAPFEERSELISEGLDYEARLFTGAYHWRRVLESSKDAPIREMVKQARTRYNAIRADLRLDVVKKWEALPEQTVRNLLT